MGCEVLKSYLASDTYSSVAVVTNFKSDYQSQDVKEILYSELSKADTFKAARKSLSGYMTDDGLKQLSSRFAKYKYSQTKRKEKSHLYISKTVLKKLNQAQVQLGTKSHDELLEYLVEAGHEWTSNVSELEHTKDLSVIMALLPQDVRDTLFAKFENIAQQFFFAGVAAVPVDKRKGKGILDDVEIQWQDKLCSQKVEDWGV